MARNPYEELANAVVLQAVRDYRCARKALRRNPKSYVAKDTEKECEQFFLSEYFSLFTSIDGRRLLASLKEEE